MKNIIKALKKTLVNKRIIILVLVIMAYIASKNEVGFARIILGFIAIPITIFALGLLWRPKINFYIVITTIFCLFLRYRQPPRNFHFYYHSIPAQHIFIGLVF